ncbi:universal stress protein [Pseudactinotalea sp. HY158]|uniref:universal stress protein n=1 Tax=Pseudactinotalea sp. HY158 TaxID=2654547 RepID=UPI00129C7267|nr:universal stress protein [Pseudactinotalea sp. HY158]QGH69757.1 universal stress protein [Pseudactinotalea sp. HY158]
MTDRPRPIIVGVIPGQPAAVVAEAAILAGQVGADLVCAFVDTSRYPVRELPDGTVVAMPIDPDSAESDVAEIDPGLRDSIASALRGSRVRWSLRALAGGAARELARLADELDAAMIVVGTREAGLRGSLHSFFSGSVAVQLAHHQHRPLVVIPLNPVSGEDELPWRKDEQ